MEDDSVVIADGRLVEMAERLFFFVDNYFVNAIMLEIRSFELNRTQFKTSKS